MDKMVSNVIYKIIILFVLQLTGKSVSYKQIYQIINGLFRFVCEERQKKK